LATFDRLLQRLRANKAELLMVLDRTENPLHTNGLENDIRCQVTRRQVRGGTHNDIGRDCRDAFPGVGKASGEPALPRFSTLLGSPDLVQLWRQQHEGALVAIQVGQPLLLVRPLYRIARNVPGGSVRRGETPEAAARRKLVEEIGPAFDAPLPPAGDARSVWDGRRDRVHFF
jgi:NUDIX domain